MFNKIHGIKSIAFFYFLYSFGLMSCSATYKLYSKGEIAYMKNSNVIITHDKKAIREDKNNGIYKLFVSNTYSPMTLCLADTSVIKAFAIEEASRIKKNVNFAKNYKYFKITLNAENLDNLSNQKENINCSYTVIIEFDNFFHAKMF